MQFRQTGFIAVIAFAAVGAGAASAAPQDAHALISANCQQCHEIKGIGDFGNVGPSLLDLKSRYPDRKDVVAIVNDEAKRNPQTVMPPFGRNLILTQQEIDTIVDYLYKQ
ncbi:MAG TPA: sulfur oxidation c-type cytochrome SoxX [Pseudolabrys sp.]|nr:sulfur oxidation c-type cytochrome SoxX [Pseudolabrys sp.]